MGEHETVPLLVEALADLEVALAEGDAGEIMTRWRTVNRLVIPTATPASVPDTVKTGLAQILHADPRLRRRAQLALLNDSYDGCDEEDGASAGSRS